MTAAATWSKWCVPAALEAKWNQVSVDKGQLYSCYDRVISQRYRVTYIYNCKSVLSVNVHFEQSVESLWLRDFYFHFLQVL